MKIYLVGGAVRDQLLGIAVKEKDWVVVGSSPEKMIELNYKPVGKDFPVFLHPDTHEEYALARTEKKTARGYQGFSFHCASDVTLEEDLKRRDLTINAIAQDENGQLIDPYGGQIDLQNKKFRHVSEAFAEDPVRILRVARFASRFTDFSVSKETNLLMQAMAHNGEIDALVPERVWKELARSLANPQPERFFDMLMNCEAQPTLFPEISPDAISKLAKISSLTNHPVVRFSAMCQNLTEKQLKSFVSRYRIPHEYSDIAKIAVRVGANYLSMPPRPTATQILSLLTSIDALRRPQRLQPFCQSTELLLDSPLQKLLNRCLSKLQRIDTLALQQQQLKGKAFANAFKSLQLKAIDHVLSNP